MIHVFLQGDQNLGAASIDSYDRAIAKRGTASTLLSIALR